MKIAKAIEHAGTITDLKRTASAYVIDYRNLSEEELRAAIVKTAPQYYFGDNVEQTVKSMFLHAERSYRILSRLILMETLLHKDGFMCSFRETEDDVVSFEQSIVDRSNEDLPSGGGSRTDALDLFRFVLEVAWEHNDSISQDEKNLIEKIKTRLKITDIEYYIMEAKLGKFPMPNNLIHGRDEINEVRRALQAGGLLFVVRDDDGTDFDVIPDEVAAVLRQVFELEMRRHGYHELLSYKAVRSKSYYQTILDKCGISYDKNATIAELQEIFMRQVKPSVLLGGLTPMDGLKITELQSWCADIGIAVSGSKAALIQRIIDYYDQLLEKPEVEGDERELWYRFFGELARRNLDFLRAQQIVQKDIECEAKFETATAFLFEKILGHTPLKLVGTSRADGAVSYQDKVLYWDNKSKETPVNLKDHIRQFDGYIKSSDKPVAGFLVIGPEFTDESSVVAMQYQVENGTAITLVKADDLKEIAEAWKGKSAGKGDDPFPLGYFIQTGRMNKALIPIQ